jgi:hypothetical protein
VRESGTCSGSMLGAYSGSMLLEKGGVQWECAVRERGRAVGVCCEEEGVLTAGVCS